MCHVKVRPRPAVLLQTGPTSFTNTWVREQVMIGLPPYAQHVLHDTSLMLQMDAPVSKDTATFEPHDTTVGLLNQVCWKK